MGTVHEFSVPRKQPAHEPEQELARALRRAVDAKVGVDASFEVREVAALDPHLTYLENNAHLMRYARLRKVGLPVGSGVTEGACKSVIEMRTNGGGQRWRPEGLEAVLTLRAVHKSDRLPRFWANFARAYRKEVTPCA